MDCNALVKASKPEEGKTSEPAAFDLRLKPEAVAADAGCVREG